MSFNINLYSCLSDSKYMTKSLTSLGVIIYNNFRGEYDLINPSFLIQTDGINPVTIYNAGGQYYQDDNFKDDLLSGKINYISIQTGNLTRYYYIVLANYVQNNLISIECHEDVLMTFKSKILLCTGIIRRNENLYNLYIRDSKIGVYEKPIIRQKVFSKGFTNTSLTYLITCAGTTPTPVTDNPLLTVPFTGTGFQSGDAANGGEILWIPNAYCDATSKVNGATLSDFTIMPTGDWVIANVGAVFKNDSPGWCVAQVSGFDDNEGTITMALLEVYNFGDSMNVYTTTNSADFKGYCFSVGGNYISGVGRWGTQLYINGLATGADTTQNYRSPALTPLSSTSNTLQFYCQW